MKEKTFEEKFPSLKCVEFGKYIHGIYYTSKVIEKHCLDKQKVREEFKKLREVEFIFNVPKDLQEANELRRSHWALLIKEFDNFEKRVGL